MGTRNLDQKSAPNICHPGRKFQHPESLENGPEVNKRYMPRWVYLLRLLDSLVLKDGHTGWRARGTL